MTTETLEPIPNLARLNPTITQIKELLEDKGHTFWVAGGAITASITGEKINDYDVFSPDPVRLSADLKAATGFTTFESEMVRENPK